jgi:transposase InsO family protein
MNAATADPATAAKVAPEQLPGDQPARFKQGARVKTAEEEEEEQKKAAEKRSQALRDIIEQRERLRARLGKPVSDEALQSAMDLLDRYPENFRPPGADACKLAVFRIKLKDSSKFHVALPRRVNPIVLQDMRRQIRELLEAGAIERCLSQPSSVYAVVMARRPGQENKWRLCIDLQELNSNTVPMPYPMPDVHAALDRLSGKKYYSTFDFSSWFQQFEIAPEDREKVAFVIPGDNISPPQMFQWKKMCFGLLNAGYWSQRQLQEALEKFEGCTGIYPFVDDVVIASDTLEEHLEKLDAFMRFCKHYNIRIKREKVELVRGAVKHLGFILSEEGQALDPARVESLLAIGAPVNLKGLKALLGSFGFIRGWIAGMADTCAPLTDLMGATAKKMGFTWGPAQEKALAALKEACQIAPALGAPDYQKPFQVSMDASDVGVGAVLWQWQRNHRGEQVPQAIMYASRRFSDRERRWEISVRELYAVKYALEKFKPYLLGYHDVVIHTDHLNLVTGLYSHSSPKIERWRMYIESCRPFRIQHVRGNDATQEVADGLSRLHVANLALEKTPDEMDEEAVLQAELGEGGMDEDMFNSHTCTVQHAWASLACSSNDQQWRKEWNAAEVLTAEQRRKADDVQRKYGIGCDLLKRMGWTVTEIELKQRRAAPWETAKQRIYKSRRRQQHKKGYPGFGLGSCNIASVPTDDTGKATTAAEVEDITYVGIVDAAQDAGGQQTPATLPSGGPTGAATASRKDLAGSREEESRISASAYGQCYMAAEDSTQTEAEMFRQAAQKWRGEFPDKELIQRCHDCTHPSFPVTWRRVVRATGVAPGAAATELKKQVRHFCDACLICQKLQPARERVAARQGSIRKRPFGEYAFDVIVLNAPDIDGNRYILTVIDSFSKAVELFPIKKASAEVITICLHDVLCRWGRPYQVRCDNAKAFAAAVTTQLLKRAKVRQHFTAPYSHNSNGQVENTNRRVMEILRAMILDDRLGPQTALQWSLLLPAVRRVLMSRMILDYGCCPNDIAYIFCPENEDSIFAEEFWKPESQEPTQDHDSEDIANLQRQHEALIDACEEAQDIHVAKLAALNEKQEVDASPILPGEFVLVNMKERPHSKINSPWSGPWQVIEQQDNDPTHPIILLQHIASKKIERFNANMCKRCNLDLLKELEEAIPIAAADNFEYEIETILDHRPRGERKRKRRDVYEFQVLWRGIERGEDNPSWEPWSNESLRASEPLQTYCSRSDVVAELGRDFLPTLEPKGAAKKKSKRSRQAEPGEDRA